MTAVAFKTAHTPDNLAAATLDKVVGPGDKIAALPASGHVRLSAQGLLALDGHVVACKGGILRQARNGLLYLEGRQKRYVPCEGDLVVGTIVERHSENFVVETGGPFNALLPQLSFEGATRRNRPPLVVGDVVYARVVLAQRDAEPILSCVDALGKASGYGHLKGGVTARVSTALARVLLQSSPVAPVLEALGAAVQFEIAVGMNGQMWVSAPTPQATIVVLQAVVQSEFKGPEEAHSMVAKWLTMLDQ